MLTFTAEGAMVWDVKSGRALCDPYRHEGGLVCAAFSPDGTRILTAGKDGTAKIHDLAGRSRKPRLIGCRTSRKPKGIPANRQNSG